MKDEEKMQRYQNIVYRLQVIENKMSRLSRTLTELERTSVSSIEIDEKAFNKVELDDCKKTVRDISSTINGTIIPSLKRKMRE